MLKIENLHAFYGKSHILHGVSFDVKDREIAALLGRSGARLRRLHLLLGSSCARMRHRHLLLGRSCARMRHRHLLLGRSYSQLGLLLLRVIAAMAERPGTAARSGRPLLH